MNEDEIDFSKAVVGGPTDLGFDYFFGNAGGPNNDSPYAFIRNARWVEVPTVMTPPEMVEQPGVVEGLMAPDWDQEIVDVRLTEEAVAFVVDHVSDNPEKPFFLYYSLSTPHIPFTAPDFIQGASREGPRGDMIALVDWVVGEVRSTLERQGVLDQTLLIVTSDNGPRRGANGHRSAGHFRGYKNTALIADTGRGDFSIRSGSWKLIALNPQPPIQQVVYELYDLGEDPYETTNLADVHPGIVEELEQLLDESKRTGLRFLE